MYDNDSAACRQFQKLTVPQHLDNYWGIDDWKFAMPWILYTDDPVKILRDRGIDMTMSLVGNNETKVVRQHP